jgi:hypothetical protein
MKRFMGLVFMFSLLKKSALLRYRGINVAVTLRGRRLCRIMVEDAEVRPIERRAGRLGIGNGVFDRMRDGIRLRRAHNE